MSNILEKICEDKKFFIEKEKKKKSINFLIKTLPKKKKGMFLKTVLIKI